MTRLVRTALAHAMHAVAAIPSSDVDQPTSPSRPTDIPSATELDPTVRNIDGIAR